MSKQELNNELNRLLKMNDFHFRIRPYSKRELARLYFPDTANDESAVANLRNLIRRVNGLGEELKEAGYKPYDKIFTPKQVGILVHYLGEP
jgi:hypothetical protein